LTGDGSDATEGEPPGRECAPIGLWTIMVAVDTIGCRAEDEEVRRSWLERT